MATPVPRVKERWGGIFSVLVLPQLAPESRKDERRMEKLAEALGQP
jgi:hypothetical protein